MEKDDETTASAGPGAPAVGGTSDGARRRGWLAFVGLLALVFLADGPVLRCDFINYDDPSYVTEEPHVRAGLTADSLSWAMTTGAMGNWHPLTWATLMLDAQLYGVNPAGFHRTNLLFHAGSTLLLYAALRRMTRARWPSAFAAALFAVHPLNVEAVAWVSERKGVVSTFFWMLALWAYGRYAERPRLGRYLLVPASMALGLLAKPMLVTLPIVLLLLDVWPLRRLTPGEGEEALTWKTLRGGTARALAIEKLPLVGLTLAFAAIAARTQGKVGALPTLGMFSATARLKNAAVSAGWYARQAVWPSGLALHYPHPGEATPLGEAVGSLLVLTAITALVWRLRGSKPYLAVGWSWYLVTLLPVVGLVQVGNHARADRYAYIPAVGLFLMISFTAAEIGRGRRRWPVGVIGGAALVLLVLASRAQAGYWRSSLTLWARTLRVTENNAKALNNYGEALVGAGRPDEAIRRFREALRLDANYALAHENLGLALDREGRHDEAFRHFALAVRAAPSDAVAHRLVAAALEKRGDVDEAIFQYGEAARLDPSSADAQNAYGIALMRARRNEEAAGALRKAVALDPGSTDALNNLGAVLASAGRRPEALRHFARAVRLDPTFTLARFNLAWSLTLEGRYDEASAQYAEALRLDPAIPQLHDGLGVLRASQGRLSEAAACYREAIRLDPHFTKARVHLGELYLREGKLPEARAEFLEAGRLRPDDESIRRRLDAIPPAASSTRSPEVSARP